MGICPSNAQVCSQISMKVSGTELEKKDIAMPSGKPAIFYAIPSSLNDLVVMKFVLSGEAFNLLAKEVQDSVVHHGRCEIGGGCYSRLDVSKIEVIWNSRVWRLYEERKAQIEREFGAANEIMLFHGTSHVDDIVAGGFDEAYAKPSGLFGAGIYFAQHASKCNQYAYGFMGGNGCPVHHDKNCYVCERNILLCRLALGKVHEVTWQKKVKQLPAGCHSVKGVPSENGLLYPEYVIYKGKQAYPNFVVTYKIVQ